MKTTTTIFQYFLLWNGTGNLILHQWNYITTIAIYHCVDRHYHHHLQKERLPGGERMGKTESFVYFRVVVLLHNLNTKQSQLILAVWNWMDVDKIACCSPSQPKHKKQSQLLWTDFGCLELDGYGNYSIQNSCSCHQLIWAVWNWMNMDKMACCSSSQPKPQNIFSCYSFWLWLIRIRGIWWKGLVVLHRNLNRYCCFWVFGIVKQFPWSRWIYVICMMDQSKHLKDQLVPCVGNITIFLSWMSVGVPCW